jgi:uncharacterized membrane protein (DUF4010 family)
MNYTFHDFLASIPKEFINFIIVTIFSLIIGLSQRKLHHSTEEHKLFGTDRTFTFIGILGYILLIADPVFKNLYMAGGFIIAILLTVNYIFKIKNFNDFGVTTIIIALLTYCIPLLLITQPFWLFLLIIVTIIIFTESKETFSSFTEKFDRHEFVTLAKFIIMAGLILPIVPDNIVIPGLPITPFKIWLAVVAISSISYVSYLLKKFVFKEAGILLSGILGGLYSSTATTVVLSRKLKEQENGKFQYIAAIIMATSMMYLRILILVLIFNKALFTKTVLSFITLIIITMAIAIITLFRARKNVIKEEVILSNDRNPLEFKAALIFTLIFVLFTFLTQFVIKRYGSTGLSSLSFIVGISDIDPFLLNIFQVKYDVTIHLISMVTFQAIISNNLAKMCYACFLSGRKNWKIIAMLFSIIILANVVILFFL